MATCFKMWNERKRSVKSEDISHFTHCQRIHQIFQAVEEMSESGKPEVLHNFWVTFKKKYSSRRK